jgi:hypothetical protein
MKTFPAFVEIERTVITAIGVYTDKGKVKHHAMKTYWGVEL